MNLVTTLGASAAAAAVCAGLVVGASASLPSGEVATTVAIARVAPETSALDSLPVPPGPPDPQQVLVQVAGTDGPSIVDQTGGFVQLAMSGGFELRPAFTPESFTGFSAISSEPVAEGDDGDVAMTVVARVVSELPPPRPNGLTRDVREAREEARGASFAILDVLPPARPKLDGVKLASADATLPLPASAAPQDAAPGDQAAAPATEPRREPGLFGLLGSFVHPGARQDGAKTPSMVQTGLASWYGPGFHGRRTASGERFNQHELTAAHRTLPFGTKVRVIDEETGRSIVVRINDRGPFARGRIIDLSRASAQALGAMSLRRVKVVAVDE